MFFKKIKVFSVMTFLSTSVLVSPYVASGVTIAESVAPKKIINKTENKQKNSNVISTEGMKIERLEDAPFLVSGRFASGYDSASYDAQHKTAKIKFILDKKASWWSQREVEFTLTEGIKFRKVFIENEEFLNHDETSYSLNGNYGPNRERNKYITLDTNKLIISDLAMNIKETASFEMEVWVSIQPEFDGDIYLNSTLMDDNDNPIAIKIASSKKPIIVDVETTDLLSSYSWQDVSDITITETIPGMLRKGTEVTVIVDELYDKHEIEFSSDILIEVDNDSEIIITKEKFEDGKITFEIKNESEEIPATIKISNISVKLSNNIIPSAKRPIRLVVGGSGVAENCSKKIDPLEATFQTKGFVNEYFYVLNR